jgi:Protein of unknown function (DUF3515)
VSWRRTARSPLPACFAVLAAAAAGCSAGPVRADPPRPTGQAAAACANLHAALPDKLEGQPRRGTEPESPLTAAWGDPAIVMRCGVGVPAAYRPTSQLYTVNGVDWLPEELTNGYLFTTMGREAGVELAVPHQHAPEINPVADLSLLVKERVPGTRPSASPSAAPTPSR